jgi:hypothetical protein
MEANATGYAKQGFPPDGEGITYETQFIKPAEHCKSMKGIFCMTSACAK